MRPGATPELHHIDGHDPSGTSCREIRISWHWYTPSGEYIEPTGEPDDVYTICDPGFVPRSILEGGGDGGGGSDSGLGSTSKSTADCGNIRRMAMSDDYGASSTWWNRFEELSGGKVEQFLYNYLQAIVSGLIAPDSNPSSGDILGLPGGRRTLYDRWTVPGLQTNFMRQTGLFNAPRIARAQSGSDILYFGPYHGAKRPDVPDGWIALRPIPQRGGCR